MVRPGMSDGRSFGTPPFAPPSETNWKIMRAFHAGDGAVYRQIINRDGYVIIERSRAENIADRDASSQCITKVAGPLLRPFMS
jgi:hypothetical protein